VSYKFLWLRVIVQEGINKSNHPIQTPVVISHATINTWQYYYSIWFMELEYFSKCEILGSHTGRHEELCPLRCDAVYCGMLPVFRRNLLPPSSKMTGDPNKEAVRTKQFLIDSCFLLDFLVSPDYRGSAFLVNAYQIQCVTPRKIVMFSWVKCLLRTERHMNLHSLPTSGHLELKL
jgi:hypothetical protein